MQPRALPAARAILSWLRFAVISPQSALGILPYFRLRCRGGLFFRFPAFGPCPFSNASMRL